MSAFSLATPALLMAYGSQPIVWPETGQALQAPISGTIAVLHDHATVPPFTLAQRDLSAVSASVTWRPADPVQLSAGWRVLSERDAEGETIVGAGDLLLGTQGRVTKMGELPTELWIAWDLKLPNAEPPLGTDETDSTLGVWLRGEHSALRWDAGAALWIAGHPHQLNAQDDALLVRGRVYLPTGPGEALVAADWRVRSPRNPHDARLRVGWALPVGQSPVQLGATAGVGLSPAAPTWQASLWLGLVPEVDGV